MYSYILKWLGASLLMPLCVIIFGGLLNDMFVLVFWPSSIALMSLGASENSLTEIVYVWGIAIGLNILLYILIGYLLHLILKIKK